jgi:hypothetical protein
MAQQFIIFHDPAYKKKQKAFGSYLKAQLVQRTANSFGETCLFDANLPYETQGFYVATEQHNKVCYECIINKDPQIINIINFITTGKNYDAKVKKFELGMEELRRITPVADPAARKCPICLHKKAYQQSFDGHFGFKCNECNIGCIGFQLFYYNGNCYTIEQAKKIYKMKAFK